jgi:hypothetical protein
MSQARISVSAAPPAASGADDLDVAAIPQSLIALARAFLQCLSNQYLYVSRPIAEGASTYYVDELGWDPSFLLQLLSTNAVM